MESKRGILTVLVVAAVFVLVCLPCSIAQDDSDRDRPPDRPRMERPGGMSRRGPGTGDRDGGRRGPGSRSGRPDDRWRRPELSDEQIDSILEELEKRDPNAAKELAELRKKDPNEFRSELRRTAGQEIGRVIIENWRKIQREEFLEWLEKYVPKEAEELARWKDKEPNLYTQKYELTWRRYDRIYDMTRRNPELAKVLVADLQLQERQRELQNKYRTAEAEEEKNVLEAQLEVVVSDRYDLLVRQKQLEYEQLLRRLEALQNEVKASMKEIETWLDKGFKEKNVKERLEFLTSERRGPRIRWYDY